jgi:hypothetical protein
VSQASEMRVLLWGETCIDAVACGWAFADVCSRAGAVPTHSQMWTPSPPHFCLQSSAVAFHFSPEVTAGPPSALTELPMPMAAMGSWADQMDMDSD